jgi:hypothetical protein
MSSSRQTLTNESISNQRPTIFIKVTDPETLGVGNKKYTTYLVTTKVINSNT